MVNDGVLCKVARDMYVLAGLWVMFIYSCVRFKFDCASYSDVFAGLCSTNGCVHTFILGTLIKRWCSCM